MEDRSAVTVLRKDFQRRSWIGKMGYVAGLVIFIFSGVGIDGVVPYHHNWMGPLALIVIVGSGICRKKRA